jgi:hypothetical protein
VSQNSPLILKRASTSRPSDQWSDGDYDVLAEGEVVGRIMKVTAPEDTPWMWTLAYGHLKDRTPRHGYEPTREAEMAAPELAEGVMPLADRPARIARRPRERKRSHV